MTGGYNSPIGYLDTTETMREGDLSWTTVSSARLSSTMGYFSAATLHNQIFTFGTTLQPQIYQSYDDIFRRLRLGRILQ